MKKYRYLIPVLFLILSFPSCEKAFLEKPMGSDLNVDYIFSTERNAMEAVAQAYSYALRSGIVLGGFAENGLEYASMSHLSGEVNSIKFNWEQVWVMQRGGMTADKGAGVAMSEDGFGFNYKAIRQCYLVIENIDKVSDLTQTEKDRIKAEMMTLIAYRYQEMFKRYGGVPIVDGTLSIADNIKIPRATLEVLLKHIVDICDKTEKILPNSYSNKYNGRLTKGVALAIKAEVYMFAARPLFNSESPYLSHGAHNNLICFGKNDPTLWQKAIDASEAVLDWSKKHGFELINTGSPLDDYGTAVATPGNREVLLAYKEQKLGDQYSPHTQSGGANSMSYYMLLQYYRADGTEQTWLNLNEEKPYKDFAAKIQEMEPRYKASAMAAGINAWNNPGSERWSCRVVADGSIWEGRTNNEGCGRRVKFWYNAGNRNWFEFPIYRLAEFYLNLAEAYNEIGDDINARYYLKQIRNRAGLSNDIVETGKDELRRIIQREWAVEFYEECHMFFDVKHWKQKDIGQGIIGGPKYGFVYTYITGRYGYSADDYISYALKERYNGFWAPTQYLHPIPAAEVNKGYIVQNPGY